MEVIEVEVVKVVQMEVELLEIVMVVVEIVTIVEKKESMEAEVVVMEVEVEMPVLSACRVNARGALSIGYAASPHNDPMKKPYTDEKMKFGKAYLLT